LEELFTVTVELADALEQPLAVYITPYVVVIEGDTDIDAVV
jgi:hypothetical protein